MSLGNGDILFWMISQRILPPIVVVVPLYVMFQAVRLLDTHLALILLYAVANLPIVVWLMHDFFANLPIELEESAQLDGATRFGIFWEIVMPLTRPGLAATTLLILSSTGTNIFCRVPFDREGADHADHGRGQEHWRERCVVVGDVRRHRSDDHSGDHHGGLLTRFISKGVLLGAVKG